MESTRQAEAAKKSAKTTAPAAMATEATYKPAAPAANTGTPPESEFIKEGEDLGDLPPANDDYLNEGNESHDYNAILDKLAAKSTNELNEITGAHLKFEGWKDGQEMDFVCTGKTSFMDKDGVQTMAVGLVDKDRTSWICAAKVVLDSCLKIEQFPQGVRIRYQGKVKSGNNSYHSVKVFML